MEIVVRGKHLHVPEHVEERARAKLSKLIRYLPLLDEGTCDVDISQETSKDPSRRYNVHVNVSAHGVHLQATGHAAEPEAAIDHAVHVLTRQAERKKAKLYSHGKHERLAEAPTESAGSQHFPAKVKRFVMKPMTIAEAIEQIEASGHDFYVFHHAEEEKVAVLYRRHAGGYGMILPELP